jgi:hypothetical protein
LPKAASGDHKLLAGSTRAEGHVPLLDPRHRIRAVSSTVALDAVSPSNKPHETTRFARVRQAYPIHHLRTYGSYPGRSIRLRYLSGGRGIRGRESALISRSACASEAAGAGVGHAGRWWPNQKDRVGTCRVTRALARPR